MATFSTQLLSELFERDYHRTDVHTSLYVDGINHHIKYSTRNSTYIYIKHKPIYIIHFDSENTYSNHFLIASKDEGSVYTTATEFISFGLKEEVDKVFGINTLKIKSSSVSHGTKALAAWN